MTDVVKSPDEESPPKEFDFDEIIAFSPEVVESQENVKEVTAFQCAKCEFVHSNADAVQHHQKIHERPPESYTEVVVYVCSLCFGQYNSVEDLRGHMIEFHKCRPSKEVQEKKEKVEKKPVEKPTVEVSPPAVETVKDAVKEPESSPVELHPVPFKDFKLILRRHLILKCSKQGCSFKFESDDKRNMHLKCHKDGTVAEFKCSECGIAVENWRRCSVHLWKTHRIAIGLLHCPLCAYASSASVRVWRHMQTHGNWKSKVLKSMKTKKEKERPPPAPRAKYYAQKSCDICNRTFVNGKTLSKHVKSVHNKIKPYICNVCGLKTTRKSVLAVHMRQHTGEKPLQCKVCRFRTRDPSTLKKHEMRHEKTGKLKCPACSRTFIQTVSLKNHIRTNHPEEYKKISCDLCSYVTITAEKLEVHMRDHSKGLIPTNEDSLDAPGGGRHSLKDPGKFNAHGKLLGNAEISSDCFLPLESVDSIPHVPAVDTGGVTIPAPAHSEDTQFPTFLNN